VRAELAALQEDLRDKGVHSILAQFADIHGVAKGKLVPLAHLHSLADTGAGFAGPSIWGTGLPRHGATSEYYGRVVPESAQLLPWMPGVARMVCDGFAGGQPLATCSRQMLKGVLASMAARGWTLNVGIEPEFFLLKQSASGDWLVSDERDTLDKPSYDLKSISRNFGFLDTLREYLQALGYSLLQIDHEDAPGQYEINYEFANALKAADDFMLFKMAAHAAAELHGSTFSCMAKPFAEVPGSGLHFHLSITDASGAPVLADANAALGLSPQGYRFVAGLLRHADALAALCAPTSNSYRRLAVSESASGTTWSPVWKSYGDNNRTTLVRTVPGSSGARLEWRMPDPQCNVYAAIAGVCAAGMLGMEHGYDVPQPYNDDLYECSDAERAQLGLHRLPESLGLALDALEGDAALKSAIGSEFCMQYLSVKRGEWQHSQGQSMEWERRRYASYF
jgi:glutamine synthetase